MPEPDRALIMKRMGRKVSLFMGVTLSFFLSLVGNLSSGHFAVPLWLLSFAVSTAVSLLIGFFVPTKLITDGACKKLGLAEGKFGTRCVESLISDLIYTPIITLIMVGIAYAIANKMATQHGAPPLPFLPMFLHSLILSLIVGFVLIFIFTPIYVKLIVKPPVGKKA